MTRFADLIGQEMATTVLRKAVREDRVTHAYLFAGPEGIGKLTAALALAAALDCEQPDGSGDSCGQCVSCGMTAGAGHPDVEVISPDGAETKIRQMRQMRRTSYYGPIRGRWKVVVIEQADTLNENSSNCILKTLEEPPPYLVLILLSRNPALLLPTIRSRCFMVRFSHAPADALAQALVERFGADEEEARFLAAYSEGRPGAAISLLGNEDFFAWRRQIASLARKISSSSLQHAIRLSADLQKLASQQKSDDDSDESEASAEADGPAEAEEEQRPTPPRKGKRVQMLSAIDALMLWYRDLLTLSISGRSAQLVNSDLREELQSSVSDPARISSAIETLLWARRAVEGNANVQLMSDVVMMRLLG